MEIVLDVAFVVAAAAFFKQQFGLTKWGVIGAVFAVSLGVAFLPDLLAAFPLAAPYVKKVILVVQLLLAAPGVFDLTVNLQAKFAQARVNAENEV